MAPRADPRLVQTLRSFSTVLSTIVVLVGCLVLVGWAFDITTLKGVFIGLVSMKANTALAFISVGVSLWLLRTDKAGRWRRIAAQVGASFALLLGLLNLGEYLFDRDFGIDQLLFRDLEPGPVPPGRMATTTAIDFVMIGTALLFISVKNRHYLVAQLLSLPPIGLSILTLLGYAFGVGSLYSVGPYFSQALHSRMVSQYIT